jgi:hypothetical protein
MSKSSVDSPTRVDGEVEEAIKIAFPGFVRFSMTGEGYKPLLLGACASHEQLRYYYPIQCRASGRSESESRTKCFVNSQIAGAGNEGTDADRSAPAKQPAAQCASLIHQQHTQHKREAPLISGWLILLLLSLFSTIAIREHRALTSARNL